MSTQEFIQGVQSGEDGQVDVTNCEKEPIHIPGAIQPHGVLLALAEPELTIVQVSSNTGAMLGRQILELLGKSVDVVMEHVQLEQLREYLGQNDLRFMNPLKLNIRVREQLRAFDGIIHRSQGTLILELEPAQLQTHQPFSSFYHIVRAATFRLQSATDLQTLSQIAAEEVRRITGFDRVMIYRFDKQWNGEVIAEARRDDLTPYLDLHYPASDIPAQARELYRRNWLRLIADVEYQPAPIVPTDNPLTGQPLDLSFSVLRSVSPVHIQYLKNMGVGASLSVSILKNNALWGLISCHHNTAKYIPYEIREACEFLGQMLSLQLVAKEDYQDYVDEVKVKGIQTRLLEALVQDEHPQSVLLKWGAGVLEMVNAQGAILYFNDQYVSIGRVPAEQEGRHLIMWLQQNMKGDVYSTDALPLLYPDGERIKDVASGLLAISISKVQGDALLWFRAEALQTVRWGGDPNKPVEIQGNERILHPRASFDAWSQTVSGTARPWRHYELDAARVLRGAIVDRVLRTILLRRADELVEFNERLQNSNRELDAFAYAASHDLKEPLRGINNYAIMLREDYKDQLSPDGVAKLDTLMRLTQRMDELINSLLHFSRLSSIELAFVKTDLNEIIQKAIDILSVRIEETKTQIRIPRPLPTIICDRVRVGELYSNLLSNALKYNDKQERWIEIGFQEPAQQDGNVSQPIVFYVRDNGIGIREKHLDAVFRIFKRLHGRNAFGGGNGVGLTIVKRIVERHGGKIWVESVPGEGTTFYFTWQEDTRS